MMLRPRLSRTYGLALLAITTLLAVSYFPFTSIRAATTGATILPSAGKPLVNLKNPQTLKVTYTGSADATAALQNGSAIPTAMAAADFNADGAMDVVAGYSTKNGGVVVLMSGNPDAYAPADLTLYGKAAKGNVPATFLPQAAAFAVPGSPDLLATGDFNRDGSKDVLVGSRGGALYLLAGDGHGNLLAPQAVTLPGQVTALAVTADGHVAVSVDGPNGPQLAMLAPGAEGLTSGAIYPLPARGDAMAWGNLGVGADLAIGAGTNVAMFYNALASNPQTETVTVPFNVKGLALGDFIWDRDGRTEISVLADDGTIHILQHGTLNTAPLTAAELPARRAAIRGHHAKPATPPNPTALGAWTVAKQLPYTGSAPSGPVSASAFNSPRVAQSSTHDLIVLDAATSQLHILDTSGKTASPSADVSSPAHRLRRWLYQERSTPGATLWSWRRASRSHGYPNPRYCHVERESQLRTSTPSMRAPPAPPRFHPRSACARQFALPTTSPPIPPPSIFPPARIASLHWKPANSRWAGHPAIA